MLIDNTGKILADYGKTGGFATWAPDGKTAYIAETVDSPQSLPSSSPIFTLDALLPPSSTQPSKVLPRKSTTQEFKASQNLWVVSKAQGASAKPMFCLTSLVVDMEVSPDGNWLVISIVDGEGSLTGAHVLIAQNLDKPDVRMIVARRSGPSFAFTGPHRLAFTMEPPDPRERVGKLVETVLDDSGKEPELTPMLDVMIRETPWIQAIGENLVFSSIARSLPGSPVSTDPPLFKIYYYSRDDKGLSVICDSAGPYFALDPSGKQILFQKIIPATKAMEARHEIAVMNINGSSSNTLWSFIPDGDQIGCIPTWQDSEHISYLSPDPSKDQANPANRTTYDLTLYQIDPAGRPRAVRNLSQSWPTDLKPSIKQPAPIVEVTSIEPATLPSTRPADTQPATSQPASTQPAASQPATSPSASTQPSMLPTSRPSQPATLPAEPDNLPAASQPILAPPTTPAPSAPANIAPAHTAPASSAPTTTAPATTPTTAPAAGPIPLPATMPAKVPPASQPSESSALMPAALPA